MKKVLDMQPYRELIGDSIPQLPLSVIGKYRLHKALHGKFGSGYKNNAHAQRLMKHFDTQVKISKVVK